MVEAQFLQLVQNDLAPHVLDRRDRPPPRVAAQDSEHALGLAPRA
jgi:hypothetical protein